LLVLLPRYYCLGPILLDDICLAMIIIVTRQLIIACAITMIRLLLYSQDLSLQPLLAPTLGCEFSLFLERPMDRIREIISKGQCDVLILDLDSNSYPIQQQLGFFEEIRGFGVPVVVMTDDDSRATAMDLVQRGVYNYIRKPPVLPELKIVIRRAHEYAVLKRELESVRQRLPPPGCDQLIGSSARSQVVYDLIRRVANLEASVLITGESGTGKELIARAIHNLSDRRDRPFVAVSCGAIPENLIEAELFGAEKGAFTGAAFRRKGFMEEAGDGTLFFDEVGEFSPHTQVKLLRVLQEREFSRLGSSQLVPLRARLLFATHRNLLEMVEERTFREDLYYRVNVMGIKAPGLRDRTEDIPVLAQHFLDKYSRLYKRSMTRIAPNAMALLLEHEWPGNVRELENVIQGAIILSDDDAIHPRNLPNTMQHPDLLGLGDSLPGASFEEQMRDYKIKLARAAVEECHGNKTLAAQSLRISRTYLHRLIKGPVEDDDPMSAVMTN
jgi:DNA-binding NtrC family response regulator